MEEKIEKSDEQWRKDLTPEQYRICRLKETEPAFTGRYWNAKQAGMYKCVCCGSELFDSDTKFDSGTGWPSFYDVVENDRVRLHEDHSHGMRRTEITCARCGAHLGHLFDDGPRPTGLRYCVNSASLDLKPRGGGPEDPAKPAT